MPNFIRPFAALRPAIEYCAEVIAPPYDVLNRHEAQQRAEKKPYNFLHISRPEIDLPKLADNDPRIYQQGAKNFQHFLKSNLFTQDSKPAYYIYQVSLGAHTQTGFFSAVSTKTYRQGKILRHEHTRPKKVADRVHLYTALNAQISPVLLIYKQQQDLDKLLQQTINTVPLYDVVLDHVQHRVWLVDDPKHTNFISQRINQQEFLYIADGHHRCETAAELYANNPKHDYFLAALFPDTQLKILSYNRLIKDLNGQSKQEFMQKLSTHFKLQQSDHPVMPTDKLSFGMYLSGQWYQLRFHAEVPKGPVQQLSVSLLHDYLIQPLLGINDPRTNERIHFVGGQDSINQLEQQVDNKDMALAFTLCPTNLNELLTVAEQGCQMPPKSTWFEPKMASGLIIFRL